MNTLNQIEMVAVCGGQEFPGGGQFPGTGNQNPLDQWAYDLLMRQLQEQAEEAERKAWQEFMASQAA